MATQFIYTKTVNAAQLHTEIEDSDITIAISDIATEDTELTISFKADLSVDEVTILNSLVSEHIPVEEEGTDRVILDSPVTPEDDIPYLYSTSRPMNHYTCFLGAGDSETRIGGGPKCIFKLEPTDSQIHKDFTFHEDIFIKDGYMIVKDAPMGASVDIDIVHPVMGATVGTFGREIPIFGTGWFPLNTEDRGKLPAGMILRIIIHNASGIDDEEAAASFYVCGRFEVFRPDWGTNGTPLFNR